MPVSTRLALSSKFGFALLGASLLAAAGAWLLPREETLHEDCDSWLDRPVSGWLVLSGCRFDLERVVLESDAGDFETLANRVRGLSSKPYPEPPRWVSAWVPLRAARLRRAVVPVVYRLESLDLMTWLEKLERADEAQKERLWADAAPLRRLVSPGALWGKAEKATRPGLGRALGLTGASALMTLSPGTAPEHQLSLRAVGLSLGFCALLAFGFWWRRP